MTDIEGLENFETLQQVNIWKSLNAVQDGRAKWPNAVLFEKKGGATGAPFPGDPPRVRQVKRFLKKKKDEGSTSAPGGWDPPLFAKTICFAERTQGGRTNTLLREL